MTIKYEDLDDNPPHPYSPEWDAYAQRHIEADPDWRVDIGRMPIPKEYAAEHGIPLNEDGIPIWVMDGYDNLNWLQVSRKKRNAEPD